MEFFIATTVVFVVLYLFKKNEVIAKEYEIRTLRLKMLSLEAPDKIVGQFNDECG
jgi:hypothetical protein